MTAGVWMAQEWVTLDGIVQRGYGVASGAAADSPYPRGTIEMQMPFFQALGLDLSGFFPGTLNVSIAPHQFSLRQPQYTFEAVQWSPEHAAETFSFCACQMIFGETCYPSLIYYPHPETKLGHFQDSSVLEVLAPPIAGIEYGDRVTIQLHPTEIEICSP